MRSLSSSEMPCAIAASDIKKNNKIKQQYMEKPRILDASVKFKEVFNYMEAFFTDENRRKTCNQKNKLIIYKRNHILK